VGKDDADMRPNGRLFQVLAAAAHLVFIHIDSHKEQAHGLRHSAGWDANWEGNNK